MPTSQTASAQPSTSGSDLLRAGGGGEVEVVAEPAEQRVADRAADQRELVPGRREPLGRARDTTGATRTSSATARC